MGCGPLEEEEEGEGEVATSLFAFDVNMGSSSSKTFKPAVLFEHVVENIRGESVSLSTLKGKKAYLVINVASA